MTRCLTALTTMVHTVNLTPFPHNTLHLHLHLHLHLQLQLHLQLYNPRTRCYSTYTLVSAHYTHSCTTHLAHTLDYTAARVEQKTARSIPRCVTHTRAAVRTGPLIHEHQHDTFQPIVAPVASMAMCALRNMNQRVYATHADDSALSTPTSS